jgi:hypothetical protein
MLVRSFVKERRNTIETAARLLGVQIEERDDEEAEPTKAAAPQKRPMEEQDRQDLTSRIAALKGAGASNLGALFGG